MHDLEGTFLLPETFSAHSWVYDYFTVLNAFLYLALVSRRMLASFTMCDTVGHLFRVGGKRTGRM